MRKAGIVLSWSVVAILAALPADGSTTVSSDSDTMKSSSRSSSAVVFSYHGKSYTGPALRRVSTSNHCVPAARVNHFDCYDSRSAARTAYRERARSDSTAAAIPPPPDVTLINNDIGPNATIMLPFFEVPRLSDYGWNNRADVVKIEYYLQIQYAMYNQSQYVQFINNLSKGSHDIQNNILSSMKS
jgi:hypothetical protein